MKPYTKPLDEVLCDKETPLQRIGFVPLCYTRIREDHYRTICCPDCAHKDRGGWVIHPITSLLLEQEIRKSPESDLLGRRGSIELRCVECDRRMVYRWDEE